MLEMGVEIRGDYSPEPRLSEEEKELVFHFFRLSGSRSPSGNIPFSEIEAYCNLFEIEGFERERFAVIMFACNEAALERRHRGKHTSRND